MTYLVAALVSAVVSLGFAPAQMQLFGAPTTGANYVANTLKLPNLLSKNCLGTDGSGLVQEGTCTGGGGGGGGTWATTTSTVAGRLINYSLNTTDIVAIGSNSTTTAEYWFDPNTLTSYLSFASSTGITASSFFGGNGSASVPSYTFTNDATIGLFRSASGVLGLAGNAVSIASELYHEGDTDTTLTFSNDQITLGVGGVSFLDLLEGATDILTANPSGLDVDFIIESDTHIDAFQVIGSDGSIDFGAYDCSANLNSGKLTVDASGNVTCADDLSGSGGVGLSTSTPIVDTYVIYGTSASTVGAEAAFTYDDATNALTIGSGGAGDSTMLFGPDTSNQWILGYDETDKSFAIASSTALGTLNALTISKGGLVSASNATTTLLTASTAWLTNLFIGADTLAEYISDTAGAFFTGNTETGITVTYQDADNTVDVVCDTASGSVFGCLSSTDWTTFNNKQAALTFSYPLQNSANTISLAFGTTTANSWSLLQNFTAATSTNLGITNSLSFGGVTGNSWDDFCVSITGSADLCDGSDATGGGGATFGQAWETYGAGGWIAPTTTLGVIVSASSTFTQLLNVGDLFATGDLEALGSLEAGGYLFLSGASSEFTLGASGAIFQQDGDGALTFVGNGDASGEVHTLTFNLDDTANTIGVSSLTATDIDWAALNLTTSGRLTSGSMTVTSLTSALLATDGSGVFSEYAGSSCTNQAVTAISALGVATCTTLNGSYLDLTANYAWTGNQDFGGSAFLEIPNGANPTANDPGEIAHDTTDNQLIVDDFVMPMNNVKIWSATISSTTPEFITAGLLKIPTQLDGYTMTAIRCSVQNGTSKVIAVEDESTNSTEDITCAASVTSDDGTITNASVTAAEEMYIDFGATSGAVDYVAISVFGTWTRE